MKLIKNILLVAFVLLMVLPLAVSAAPYKTYTYSSDGEMLVSPDAYVPELNVDSNYIGLEVPFDDPRDLFVGPDEKLYLADAANNRIIVLTKYYKYDFEIAEFINDHGVPDTFANPSGVFVNKDYIYVCDTDNNRLVLFDTTGKFVKIIPQPESNLFEEGAIYKPVAVAVDAYGRIFVVSSTTYQGVIVLDVNANFYGFIGAQTDTLTAMEKIWRRFQTEEQRASKKENTAKELNNIAIDKDNFIYVTTSALEDDDLIAQIESKDKATSPVKKLNASGADVLKRNGDFAPSGEVKTSVSATATIKGASKLVDVACGPVGTWSIADEKRSKVFTYDENGNLLFAFGDMGSQLGNIAKISSIVYQGSKLLILDGSNDSIVVYKRTEYGDLLINALQNDADRKYDMSTSDWTEILKRNNNYNLAYLQLGKASARQGDYDTAMGYFKKIKNTEDYSAAYKEVRADWASSYFWIIPVVIVVAVILLAKFFGYAAKVNSRAALKIGRKSLKEEVLYAFYVMLHPFDGFWDLKHEKRGSVRSAIVILVMTIIAFFYKSVGTGYIFSPDETKSLTIIGSIAAILVPLLLWVIANWCLTTLFEGEGSLKDVFVATCYALIPIPLLMIPGVFVSQFLILNESGILSLIFGIGFVWMALLLITGMMTTHDYTFGKNILTCIATILGMAIIMFIVILFSTLMTQIVGFITGVAEEINYRA